MREELIPKKDPVVEEALTKIILEIEDVLEEPDKSDYIEMKIQEANKLLEQFGGTVDIVMIENYYSWTDLEGFVGSLMQQIPNKIDLTEEELVELLVYIQDNVVNATDEKDLEYKMDFYYEYFAENYSEDLYDEIFDEEVDVVELAKKLKNHEKSVICL